jgi:hypothetical protein
MIASYDPSVTNSFEQLENAQKFLYSEQMKWAAKAGHTVRFNPDSDQLHPN